MAKVIVSNYSSLDSAMKAFKRKYITEGILNDVRKHSYYISRGQKNRLKKQQQERNAWVEKQRAKAAEERYNRTH